MAKALLLRGRTLERLETALNEAQEDKGDYTYEVVALGGVTFVDEPSGGQFILPISLRKKVISGCRSPR